MIHFSKYLPLGGGKIVFCNVASKYALKIEPNFIIRCCHFVGSGFNPTLNLKDFSF
jgi:hypothetical protein